MDAVPSVDVSADPSVKEKVLSGELFTWTCPSCGEVNLVKYPLMYHDPAHRLLLVLLDASISAEAVPDGYCARRVRSVGELIEKIKIADCGLDDMVVEMCKRITSEEMQRPGIELKFLKTEGADNDMIFTYPDKGEMQLVAVGFNVYEDCAGILQRNPRIRASATGLVTVDPAWLAKFFR